MTRTGANGGSGKLVVRHLARTFRGDADAALALSADGLSKDEILRRTGAIVAVADVSFDVAQGEIFVVMGLSGSGKSTLVRCINRLITPTRGTVEVDGEDIASATPARLREIRLRKISMVFQHFALLPHRSVVENAEYGLKIRRVAKRERREKAMEALDAVGLAAWAESRPSGLSGGMQQRVGLARALAVDPEILLMDEPFSALDPLIRREMQQELLKLQERFGTTIVFITHDLHEALTLGDRVAIMRDGRFVQVGAPAEIVVAPADDYVAEFTRDVDRSRVLPASAAMNGPADEAKVTVPAAAPIHEAFALLAHHASVGVTDKAGRVVGRLDPDRIWAVLAGDAEDSAGDRR